ncbi:MAG: hypothetical protein N4A65_16445 [Cohaesibacter sp.]|jgi:hypothetical protein|nr:hypothetical protein [Cohaesibacter sp.]
MKRLALIASSLLLLSGGSAIAGKALTEADFKQKIVGHTLKWKQEKASGTVHFSKSGKITITFNNNKKMKKDSGRWAWRNGANCTRYNKLRNGKEKCTKVYFSGSGFRGASGSILTYK